MEFALEISVTDNSKNGVNWVFDKDQDGTLSFQDMVENFRQSHIYIAKEALRDEQSRDFDKDPRKKIDNKFDIDEQFLKPFGKIEYFAKALADKVILQLYKEISDRSPVKTGVFKMHNYVFLNSNLVARNESELKSWLASIASTGFKKSDRLRFVNVTPYSARLEYAGNTTIATGRNAGKKRKKKRMVASKSAKKLIKKPNGAYFLAAKAMTSKFGGIGVIKHEFIPNGYEGILIKADNRFGNKYVDSPKNRNKKRVGLPYVYTSILVTLSDRGVVLN